MKKEPPANPFTDETRALYDWERCCWDCGSNQSVELDHIFGRISDSPYNAFVICRKCHNKKGTLEYRLWQFKVACRFLESVMYYSTDKDLRLIKDIEEKYGR